MEKMCEGNSSNTHKTKIALATEYLTKIGGAERVTKELSRIYPEAPIFSLLSDEQFIKKCFPKKEIKTSFLRKFPNFLKKRVHLLLPFLPVAPETIDLKNYKTVISSSHSFIKGIITKPTALHFCYCHTPPRFLWNNYFSYLKEREVSTLKKILLLPLMHYIRMWDRTSANRVDYFIANSRCTQERIKKYYHRDSTIIYPPVDTEYFKPKNDNKEEYFLVVSRLSEYKNIDKAIEACNKMKLPLKIVGKGRQEKYLRKIAEPHIEFLGNVSKKELLNLYQNSKALIMPSEEDFGLVAAESLSCGKPVVALKKGGALEIIKEGENGEFFDDPVVEVLADGLRRFLIAKNKNQYNPEAIRESALKFRKENFTKNIKGYITLKTQENEE